MRAFMAETETVRNRVRACALCGRRESYGADGKLYVEHGKAQCPEHAFTEWADTVSAGRASPEEEAKAETVLACTCGNPFGHDDACEPVRGR